MSNDAIEVRDLGIRFLLQHLRTPTVHSGLVRFLRGNQKPRELWALRHVDVSVPRGGVLGVIGANGSGKSTFLRVLSRILHPDEGEVVLRGRVSSLISLGAGFQSVLSGYENIFYKGMLMGLSRQEIETKIDRIIDFSGLGERVDTPVGTYSSGMRARLAFSIAVHVEPEILLVDEVIGVGDAQFRTRSQSKMEELFSRGATIVMVQHNMGAIVDQCNQCMWLDKGSVRMLGEPLDVVNSYLASRDLPPIQPKPSGVAVAED